MTKSTTKYTNNARTTLVSAILSTDTTLSVTSSVGFPSISSAADHFYVTLDDGTNIEIVKVTGVSSNTFTGCVRGQEGTTARSFAGTTKVENRLTAGNISNFARLQDRLGPVTSIEDLDAPAQSDGNSILSSSVDAAGFPIVAVVNGAAGRWHLLNYPDVVATGTVGSGSTLNSFNFAGVGNYLIDNTPKMYIVQFITGSNAGRLRYLVVSPGPQTVNWTTALPTALSAGDTYEVYRCISSFKMPTGMKSDRIFFENNSTLWFDYTLPDGKNAVTAGPITIASGVTVTVPVNSAWSIV